MSGHVELWGWDTAAWQKVRTDPAGHLQVDTLSSALPAGAATSANQATIIGHIDTLETISGRCYGYDTANWQYLQVEAAALHNLRVKLYDGANGIDSSILNSDLTTERGLIVKAILMAKWGANNFDNLYLRDVSIDAGATPPSALGVLTYLAGYNGATWDRLRVESNVAFNLRVKLYDGANGIDSAPINAGIADTTRGLVTATALYGRSGANWFPIEEDTGAADAVGTTQASIFTISRLYGYNGTTWDRLRVDASKNLKVNIAAVDATHDTADSFGGNVYSKTMTMANNNATRFESAAILLRDIVIIVQTHPMLLGETGVEVYPVGAGETVGFTKVDISTLYFKNAGADNNGVITILATEE